MNTATTHLDDPDAPVVLVRDLVFEYPTARALHGVNLAVEAKTITALVGPNGAGKTTLMRCIAGLEVPFSGTVFVAGRHVAAQPRKVHEELGFLSDFFGLYDNLSVLKCLVYAARSHGLSERDANAAARATAEKVGLSDRLNNRAGELSRGLRQRLAIGQAIVHSPKVLLLDEPASGLDPRARRELSGLLLDLRANGITLIVSSHILAELEDYSDNMIIMEDGRVKGHFQHGDQLVVETVRIQIEFADSIDEGRFSKDLATLGDIRLVSSSPTLATIDMVADPSERANVLAALIANGYRVAGFAPQRRTLEETYFDEVTQEV